MKITFFIGNGYDINIGLKTAYHDFLKWYVEQPSKNDTITDFKKIIEDGIEYWSDLEIALGKYTTRFSSFEQIEEVYDDINNEISVGVSLKRIAHNIVTYKIIGGDI